MLNRTSIGILIISLALLFVSGCTGSTAPPTFDFCQQTINSGIPSAVVLLDPGETPITEVTIRFDRWDIDSNPPELVKESSIADLNGQVWKREDPVSPNNWWTIVPQEEWSSNPLDSLVAVYLRWDFSPPLTAYEKLVYDLQLKYLTPEGNSLLITSEAHRIPKAAESDNDPISEMCQDFLAFSTGG